MQLFLIYAIVSDFAIHRDDFAIHHDCDCFCPLFLLVLLLSIFCWFLLLYIVFYFCWFISFLLVYQQLPRLASSNTSCDLVIRKYRTQDPNSRNNFTCHFCGNVNNDGVYRLKCHFIGGSSFVMDCTKMSETGKVIKKSINAKKKRGESCRIK